MFFFSFVRLLALLLSPSSNFTLKDVTRVTYSSYLCVRTHAQKKRRCWWCDRENDAMACLLLHKKNGIEAKARKLVIVLRYVELIWIDCGRKEKGEEGFKRKKESLCLCFAFSSSWTHKSLFAFTQVEISLFHHGTTTTAVWWLWFQVTVIVMA